MLFTNWLDEGFYEDDGYGLTKIDDPDKLFEARKSGNLYHCDGFSTTKV